MQSGKPSLSEIFTKYADDHKAGLSMVGVIASVTALFLNINQDIFGDTLRSLQLLLLLLLLLSLIFLSISTLTWFVKNADSWFAGLITSTLGLLIIRIGEFVLSNFRNELNDYLLYILLSVVLVVGSFLDNLKKKAEVKIEKTFRGVLVKALMFGLCTFLFLYALSTTIALYTSFAVNKGISGEIFIQSVHNIFFWLMAIWVAVSQFCTDYFFRRGSVKLWLKIFLISLLTISALTIIVGPVFDLLRIFLK